LGGGGADEEADSGITDIISVDLFGRYPSRKVSESHNVLYPHASQLDYHVIDLVSVMLLLFTLDQGSTAMF
jgi:hypothetical protein